MRISNYWFRTRRDGNKYKTLISKDNPKKCWSTACICDECMIPFNRTFETIEFAKFGFKKCDKCSMKKLNKTLFTDEVRAKISKATSDWHNDPANKTFHANLVTNRYKDKEYSEKHKEACKKRSNDPKYRQKLSDNAARGEEHAIKTSCGLRGINIKDFSGFVTEENKILRQKCKSSASAECLQKADFICDICLEKGGKLNAHHLDGWNWCIETTL